jgi:hypothetical protein
VAVDANGNIYVADAWYHRVQQFTSSRLYTRTPAPLTFLI